MGASVNEDIKLDEDMFVSPQHTHALPHSVLLLNDNERQSFYLRDQTGRQAGWLRDKHLWGAL